MRWLLTYADMITLLTAFFIMMYSMSVLNLEKFKQVAISIRSGFNGQLQGAGIYEKGGVVTLESDVPVKDPANVLDAVMKQVQDYIKKHRLAYAVTTKFDARGLAIALTSDGLLFDIGDTRLRPEAKTIIDGLMKILGRVTNEIVVEGHTCDLPISTPLYPTNWELSTARATTVVRYLIDTHHIDSHRISAAGYADSRPLVPNDSEAHRQRNRRVVIVVVSGQRSVLEKAQTAPAAPPPAHTQTSALPEEKEPAAPAAAPKPAVKAPPSPAKPAHKPAPAAAKPAPKPAPKKATPEAPRVLTREELRNALW